ncbi:MAG: 4Fe-4S cluster-binding domain-containing protein [Candidatus Omnitrophica bacterium]|nr:4Fe-4S cluster-binding domain-containing protein [Candidatus Omnitrophota bacterium]
MQREAKIRAIKEITLPLYERLARCNLCPRNCMANRLEGERGACGMNKDLMVYTAFLHGGEEPVLTGKAGSGTIFFSGCSLKCVYCQNYKFSHQNQGSLINENALARIMLKLQEKGACNINLVTPTHFLPQILKALLIAYEGGLDLPLVYNTSGYENPEIIRFLEGIVDIYLPDAKYLRQSLAARYSNASDYPSVNQEVIKIMYKQHTIQAWDKDLLKEGIIIRHLVLPGASEDATRLLCWIKESTPQALVSVMFQYQPYFRAGRFAQLRRRVSAAEYDEVRKCVKNLALSGWVQDLNSNEELAGVHFNKRLFPDSL